MGKYYSYIQVLLALREEYIKNELELNKLKQYIELHDEKVEDYYFRCVSSSINTLILDRTVIKSRIRRIVEEINGKIDLSMIDKVQKNAEGNYIIQEGIYKTPTIIDQEGFNEQVDKILNSPFIMDSSNQNVPVGDGYAKFTFGGIYLVNEVLHSQCGYYSTSDTLVINSSKKITDDLLYELLNSQICESSLNEWQQEIMHKNDGQVSEIIYPELNSNLREINLTIEYEKSKALLKQTD